MVASSKWDDLRRARNRRAWHPPAMGSALAAGTGTSVASASAALGAARAPRQGRADFAEVPLSVALHGSHIQRRRLHAQRLAIAAARASRGRGRRMSGPKWPRLFFQGHGPPRDQRMMPPVLSDAGTLGEDANNHMGSLISVRGPALFRSSACAKASW